MSASSKPTLRFKDCKAYAIWIAVEDLPTPPLLEFIAIIFLIFG
jgi:hypothetical protein